MLAVAVTSPHTGPAQPPTLTFASATANPASATIPSDSIPAAALTLKRFKLTSVPGAISPLSSTTLSPAPTFSEGLGVLLSPQPKPFDPARPRSMSPYDE